MTEAEFEQRVAEWHLSDSELPLHEYLVMSWDEYALLVMSNHWDDEDQRLAEASTTQIVETDEAEPTNASNPASPKTSGA